MKTYVYTSKAPQNFLNTNSKSQIKRYFISKKNNKAQRRILFYSRIMLILVYNTILVAQERLYASIFNHFIHRFFSSRRCNGSF